MNNHPANNGKVMLSIWVDAPLRDYVRARAMEAKQPVSEWAGNALRRAVPDVVAALAEADRLRKLFDMVDHYQSMAMDANERAAKAERRAQKAEEVVMLARQLGSLGHLPSARRRPGREPDALSRAALRRSGRRSAPHGGQVQVKFEVKLVQPVYYAVTIVVEAESEDDAASAALELAKKSGDWAPLATSGGDDETEVEEIKKL